MYQAPLPYLFVLKVCSAGVDFQLINNRLPYLVKKY